MWESFSSAAKSIGDAVAPMIKDVLDSDNEESGEVVDHFDKGVDDLLSGDTDDLSSDPHVLNLEFDPKDRDAAMVDYYKQQSLQRQKEVLDLQARLQEAEAQFQRTLMQKTAEIKYLKKANEVAGTSNRSNHLSGPVAEAVPEMEGLRHDLQVANQVRAEQVEQIKDLERRLKESQELNLQLQQNLQTSSEKVNALENEINAKDKGIAEASTELEALRKEAKEQIVHNGMVEMKEKIKTSSLEEVIEELDAAKTAFTDLEEQSKEVQERLEKEKTHLDAELRAKDASLLQAKEEVSNVAGLKDSLEQSRNELVEKVKALERSCAELAEKEGRVTKELGDARKTIKELQEVMTKGDSMQESVVTELQAHCRDLQNQLSSKNAELDGANAELRKMQDGLESLTTKQAEAIRAKENEASKIAEELIVAKNAISHLDLALKTSEAEHSKANEALGQKAAALEQEVQLHKKELEQTKVKLDAKNLELQEAMGQGQTTAEEMKKELDKTKESLESVRAQLEEKIKEGQAPQDFDENLQREIKRLKDDLAAAEVQAQHSKHEQEMQTAELKKAQQLSLEIQQNSQAKIKELHTSNAQLQEQVQYLRTSKTELEQEVSSKAHLQVKLNETEVCLSEARAQVDHLCQQMHEFQIKSTEKEGTSEQDTEALSSYQSMCGILDEVWHSFANELEPAAGTKDPQQQLKNFLKVTNTWKLENQQASLALTKILTTYFNHPKDRQLQISEMGKAVEQGIREVFQQRAMALEQNIIDLEISLKSVSQNLEATKSELQKCRRRINDLEEENAEFRKKWGQVSKKDTTIAQLQAVINQMRDHCQSQSQEVEMLKQSKDELERLVESQAKDLNVLRSENSQHRNTLVAVESQSQDAQIYRQRAEEVEQEMKIQAAEWEELEKDLKIQLAFLQQSQAKLKQELYDTKMQLKASQADLTVAQQDTNRSETALQNLQRVLEQFQAEKQTETDQLEQRLESRLKAQEKAFQAKESALQHLHKSTLDEAHQGHGKAKVQLEKQVRYLEAEVLRRDQDIDNIRHALDEAVSRLNVPENATVVDKQLVVNLMVKYFSSERSLEVLDLMARMLDFSESERAQVGLTDFTDRNSGIVGELFTTLVGPAPKPPAKVEGENLADMWANFLISEADERNRY